MLHEYKISIRSFWGLLEVCCSGLVWNMWQRGASRGSENVFFFIGGVTKPGATVPPGLWSVGAVVREVREYKLLLFFFFSSWPPPTPPIPSVLCLTARPLAAAEPRCWWMRCSPQSCQECAARTLWACEQKWQDAALSPHLSTDGQTMLRKPNHLIPHFTAT